MLGRVGNIKQSVCVFPAAGMSNSNAWELHPATFRCVRCPTHLNKINGLLPGLCRAESLDADEGVQLFDLGYLLKKSLWQTKKASFKFHLNSVLLTSFFKASLTAEFESSSICKSIQTDECCWRCHPVVLMYGAFSYRGRIVFLSFRPA